MKNIDTTYLQLLNQYPCDLVAKSTDDKRLNYLLTYEMRNYYIFIYGIEKKEQSFKFYPVTITDEELKRLYESDFRKMVSESLKTNIPIEAIMSSRIKDYKQAIEEYKGYTHATPMEPYYGDPNFMTEKASYILECAQKLDTTIPNLDAILEKIQEFKEKYGNKKDRYGMFCFPFYTEEYRKDYREFEKIYYGILQLENTLSKEAEKAWKSTLTDPNHHDDRSFKYLIHVFTQGMIPLENMGKVCCSYATEHLLTDPYGSTGIICDFDIEAVEAICSEDAGSWMLTKDEFIDRLFPVRWQLTNPNGRCVWFEYEKVSKLLLPSDLEREAIANNIRSNGEILNYSKSKRYSEIFLNSKAKAIGVFYTDDCKDIEPIKAYAEKYHLPLIHLSLQKLRENAGLPPLEEKKEAESSYHY